MGRERDNSRLSYSPCNKLVELTNNFKIFVVIDTAKFEKILEILVPIVLLILIKHGNGAVLNPEELSENGN